MTNFFAVRMPPGPGGDEFVELLDKLDSRHHISTDIEKLTNFMRSDPDSTEIRSPQGMLASEKAGGVQHLAGGRDSSFKLKSIGKEPFGTQGTSSLLQNIPVVGASAVNSHFSLLSQEPRALDAVDILLGTAPGCSSDVMWSSGAQSIDSVVQKEEQEEEFNPLFMQNPPSQQEMFPLFGDADSLFKDEFDEDFGHDSGAMEGLLKDDGIDDEFGASGDFEEDFGEKLANQGVVDDLFTTFVFKGPLYQCKICDEQFSMGALVDHWHTHPLCGYCRKRFSTQEVLSEHKRVHTDCDICGKSFSNAKNLKEHRRIHSGERPHECEICRKTFLRKSEVTIHLRTHTGEKHYECGVCQKRFTQHSILKKHLRVHTGEKPYECPECHLRFKDSWTCTRHRRVVHGFQKTSG